MKNHARDILKSILLIILLFTLTGCMGQWFSQQGRQPYLIVGEPVISGRVGEVLISVANMPQEGVASIAIGDQGISYTGIVGGSIKAEGMNGFEVLAQDFTTAAGKGRLVAVNPNSGISGGPILKITFEAVGSNPAFTVTAAKVSMGSGINTIITNWNLVNNKSYYAKRK